MLLQLFAETVHVSRDLHADDRFISRVVRETMSVVSLKRLSAHFVVFILIAFSSAIVLCVTSYE